MNSQREVIYKRRRNALFGDRLELDIMNMLYDTSEDIVLNYQEVNNYDGFKLTVLSTLYFDTSIDEEAFSNTRAEELGERLYNEALENYHRKNSLIAEKSLPILSDIFTTRGATVKNIMVPFTDGTKQIGVTANLEESISSEGKALITAMEKIIALAIIDEQWKEHLRDMDDLKQSVQNAVYEQKDPLLIYKFEGFELFKIFIARLNEETVSFLMKAEIPVQEPDEVHEARAQRRQHLREQKDESRSALEGGQPPSPNRPPMEKTAPIKSQKIVGRNERVTVQYSDGNVKKDVKFKTVEEDIRNGNCVMLEN
jgi:preprotein translocase subunit SecA